MPSNDETPAQEMTKKGVVEAEQDEAAEPVKTASDDLVGRLAPDAAKCTR